ncbi:MAG: hypothetical protein AAFO83_00200 [Cyanobacteria bacterium J06607_13]
MRDDTKILEVCDSLSATVRESAIALLQSGAPPKLISTILEPLTFLEEAPVRLADNHWSESSALGMIVSSTEMTEPTTEEC